MGAKRSSGKNSFVDSVLKTLDDFYEDVVQNLREWQPAAPKLQRSEMAATETVATPLANDVPAKASDSNRELTSSNDNEPSVSPIEKLSAIDRLNPMESNGGATHSEEKSS